MGIMIPSAHKSAVIAMDWMVCVFFFIGKQTFLLLNIQARAYTCHDTCIFYNMKKNLSSLVGQQNTAFTQRFLDPAENLFRRAAQRMQVNALRQR